MSSWWHPSKGSSGNTNKFMPICDHRKKERSYRLKRLSGMFWIGTQAHQRSRTIRFSPLNQPGTRWPMISMRLGQERKDWQAPFCSRIMARPKSQPSNWPTPNMCYYLTQWPRPQAFLTNGDRRKLPSLKNCANITSIWWVLNMKNYGRARGHDATARTIKQITRTGQSR